MRLAPRVFRPAVLRLVVSVPESCQGALASCSHRLSPASLAAAKAQLQKKHAEACSKMDLVPQTGRQTAGLLTLRERPMNRPRPSSFPATKKVRPFSTQFGDRAAYALRAKGVSGKPRRKSKAANVVFLSAMTHVHSRQKPYCLVAISVPVLSLPPPPQTPSSVPFDFTW
jgi:hypothetical protein